MSPAEILRAAGRVECAVAGDHTRPELIHLWGGGVPGRPRYRAMKCACCGAAWDERIEEEA